MKELVDAVNRLADEELERANSEFPQFHSHHEAIGVIDEEIYELTCELTRVNNDDKELHVAVFNDQYDTAEDIVLEQIKVLPYAIAEAIQVLAMYKKYAHFMGVD